MDYAVQVAALRSQENALELAKGLRAQGINAYWVGKNVQSQGMFYRVRIGKFSTVDSAYLYAEELIDSGLLGTYVIAAYEAPAPATLASLAREELKMDRLQAFVSTGSGFGSMAAEVSSPLSIIPSVNLVAPPRAATSAKLSTTTIDMVASIGTRGWLLLSSEDVIAATQKNPTALGRELAKLAAAVGSRRWSLNNDIAKLLAPSAPASVAPSASAAPVSIADLARESLSSSVSNIEQANKTN